MPWDYRRRPKAAIYRLAATGGMWA